MAKFILLQILSLLIYNPIWGQEEEYNRLCNEAGVFYENKEYLESGQKYSEAFVALGNKGYVIDRYNAACSWALAKQADSSFVQLFKIAENGNYSNLEHISKDPDLVSLHGHEKWSEVIAIIKSNKEKAEANFDRELIARLDTIFRDDQELRQQIDDIEAKHGRESEEFKSLVNAIREKDSINRVKVKMILDEHGWLGAGIIGQQGNATLFLVIQHAEIETQEKYLPMLREAVKKGNAKPSHLALLEDRVSLRRGQKQIYGSQIGRDKETGEHYVLPLIDPDNVDQRRAIVGLSPIQDYVSLWGISWDAEEYKKNLPEYEKRAPLKTSE